MKFWRFIVFISPIANVWAQHAPDTVNQDPGIYQPRRPMVEQINQQTEILRNPGIAIDNAQQVLAQQVDSSMPSVAKGLDKSSKIQDPTQMTSSFTQALGRVQGKAGPNATQAPLPELHLIARYIRGDGSKSAVIGVGGKSHMVKEGGQFSFQSGQTVYDIQINKIDKEQVDVMVLPLGKRMILQ